MQIYINNWGIQQGPDFPPNYAKKQALFLYIMQYEWGLCFVAQFGSISLYSPLLHTIQHMRLPYYMELIPCVCVCV